MSKLCTIVLLYVALPFVLFTSSAYLMACVMNFEHISSREAYHYWEYFISIHGWWFPLMVMTIPAQLVITILLVIAWALHSIIPYSEEAPLVETGYLNPEHLPEGHPDK